MSPVLVGFHPLKIGIWGCRTLTAEFLDNVLNRTKKELMVNKGIISMLKQVDGIIIPDDDTEDDAFSVSDSLVSDYEDYAFSVNNSEDDESEADDDMM
ncbi:hypothetical protein Tco_0362728 [Tanacetum coccineum]